MGSVSGVTETIEVHVVELRQLMNTLDPAPFEERDIDPKVETYIVDWAEEAPRDAALELAVHLDRPPADPGEIDTLRRSVEKFFTNRGQSKRHELRRLLKRGRMSLYVGAAFLAFASATSELLQLWFDPSGFLRVMSEGLLIGGWVAMWRPIEILLYDWWPLRADYQLFDRLRDMKVHVEYG